MREILSLTALALLAVTAEAETAETEIAACAEGEAVSFEDLAAAHKAILYGDYHGTLEMPALFADQVAKAAAGGRRVVVALEYPANWQPDLDTVMAAPDEVAALDAFAMHRLPDGRTSDAMRNMLLQLRALKVAGANITVIAADARELRTDADRAAAEALDLPEEVDRVLGQRDLDLALHAKAACDASACELIMLYAGNMHTRLGVMESAWFDQAGNRMPFQTAPAGYILSGFMPTASVYLMNRGGYVANRGRNGAFGLRKIAPVIADYVTDDGTYYCMGDDPMFSHGLSVGMISPSEDSLAAAGQ